jgi:hypothetical protein
MKIYYSTLGTSLNLVSALFVRLETWPAVQTLFFVSTFYLFVGKLKETPRPLSAVIP